ncbi:Ankyrin repeat [Macleaya cordata]|uniref:Ankyrin repeat n=1 Tax=Macleaya cordata TaxID=56857 RepID=A0A200PSV3_MACCD|nr:Ankyrin repeat [Macleaya cordata]
MERWMETPLTLAATLGLDELVIRILQKHPAAATYRGKEGKNLLHIAVENRQEMIVNILDWIGDEDPRLPLRLKSAKDDNGNTILHLAAMCNNQPSSPLQMSQEFKWFDQVKNILPKDLVNHRNKDGKTAKEVFTENHAKMVEDAKTQLTNTASTCCSALVTAVTFAAGFSIANDNDKKEKNADHRTRVVLKIFSHTYMFGLSCTAVALVQFMALLMASYKEEDFRRSLPTQYKVALATLFTAMVAMVLAFACNTYIGLYNELNPNWRNYLYLAIEVLIVPVVCLVVMRCGGVKCRVKKI